ncbi:MAG: T9SS type A sorting domain-containing protein [Bacteroidota bacterium]
MEKFKSIRQIFLFLLMVMFKQYYSQTELVLDNFEVYRTENKVNITCVIKSGKTCNGIEVLRSEDSVHFTLIGRIEGICGSTSEPVWYYFTDDLPVKNKTMYYKLYLGGYGYSNIIAFKLLDTKNQGYLISPHPADNYAIIYFENENKNFYTLNVFNEKGVKGYSDNTNENYFQINTSQFANGVYFFSITNNSGQQNILGKMLIKH